MSLDTRDKQKLLIELNKIKPYGWIFNTDGIYIRGFFISEDICYRDESSLEYISSIWDDSQKEAFFFNLNGIFSIIIDTHRHIVFAVDRLRGLPLFYTLTDDNIYISDDPRKLIPKIKNISLSDISCAEYLDSTLFVTGSDTLISEIKQVEAGTYCVYDKVRKSLSIVPYFQTEHSDFIADIDILTTRFHEAYDETARNLVVALQDRTAVVPLSGGADSRMVLSMLHQQGYKKVLCFTYGKAGNKESKISKQVATHFGYEWIMIPYTGKMWKKLRNESVLKEYEWYASMFTSTPHLQDFLAVKVLKETGKLPEDSVFVPGHTGDLITGGHITPEFLNQKMSEATFLKSVYRKFLTLVNPSTLYSEKITTRFSTADYSSMEALASASEWFNIQERQAKFIVNSVRVYEYFGYEWLIPLWDNALFEFWRHVPIEQRYQRRLYFSITSDSMPSTNDDSFRKTVTMTIKRWNPWVVKNLQRVQRMMRYWNSNLQLEYLIPINQYLKACIKQHPSRISVAYFRSRKMLEVAKSFINEK